MQGLRRPLHHLPHSSQCAMVWAWNTCGRRGLSLVPMSWSLLAARRSLGAWRFCRRALRGKDTRSEGRAQWPKTTSRQLLIPEDPEGAASRGEGMARDRGGRPEKAGGRPEGAGTFGRILFIHDMLSVNMYLYGGQAIQVKLHSL